MLLIIKKEIPIGKNKIKQYIDFKKFTFKTTAKIYSYFKRKKGYEIEVYE